MTEAPMLWYFNRSTGFVLLAVLSLATALGVLATSGRAGRGVPAFVSQSLHRNISILGLALLGAHVVTAVVDTFVDIRWWQALVPVVGSTYHPWRLGLGTLSLDLLIAVALSSALRGRIRHRAWNTVHQLSYLAWVVAVAHAIGIGTDLTGGAIWAWWVTGACVAMVGAAVAWRVFGLVRTRTRARATAAGKLA